MHEKKGHKTILAKVSENDLGTEWMGRVAEGVGC